MSMCVSEEILHAYYDGEMTRGKAAEVTEHIARCAMCAAKARTVEQTITLMAFAFNKDLPSSVPTENLRARLYVALDQSPLSASTAPSAWRASLNSLIARLGGLQLSPRGLAFAVASGLAVAALLVWLAMGMWQSTSQAPNSNTSMVNRDKENSSPGSPDQRESKTAQAPDATDNQIQDGSATPDTSTPRTPRRKKRPEMRAAAQLAKDFDETERRDFSAPPPIDWNPPVIAEIPDPIEPDNRATFFDGKTTRHLEQAQVLLRSFKNASVSEHEIAADLAAELAYEKEKSERLLYQNILLRRDAEAEGNAPVRAVLRGLEPFLLDIANLPERPSPGDVKSIKERLQKNNIVTVLQIYSARATTFNATR